MLSAVGQIGIRASDLARAVEFYRDKLGLRLLFQAPNAAFFDCGGVRLMLGPVESSSTVYYRVADIHSAVAALKSRGVVFEREPHLVAKMLGHDLWMAFLRDPDGNTVGLMCEAERVPAYRNPAQ
jgi:catechol 2,3-dioxygenase-like lactoylglutathione lyase family enzyme